MALFVENTEERILVQKLAVLSEQTSSLIGKSRKNRLDVTPYVAIFNEINDMQHHHLTDTKHRLIVMNAKIFKHKWLQKELKNKLSQLITSTTSSQIHPRSYSASLQTGNRTGYGQVHRFSSEYDIRLAEICLNEWTEKAHRFRIDILPFQQAIFEARTLKDSYNPENRGDFEKQFIRIFYVHYLNLYTNKIIHEVTDKIIRQEARSLRENPAFASKLQQIHEVENWLLRQLPPSDTFLPPTIQEHLALNILQAGKERIQQLS